MSGTEKPSLPAALSVASDLPPRQTEIVNLARARGYVGIEELAERFAMTPQTIRRDINRLCDLGLLARQHGGATIPVSTENEPWGTRRSQQSAAKAAIAKAAAGLINDQSSLFMNIGTTVEAVASEISGRGGYRIVTNNLNIARIMSNSPDTEVIVTGGHVRARDQAVTGETSVDFVRQFRMDLAVIGISGIDEDSSLLDFDVSEVRAARAIIENARTVVLVADHTKFGRKAMARVDSLVAVDILITDRNPPEPFLDMITRCETRLIVAPSGSTPSDH